MVTSDLQKDKAKEMILTFEKDCSVRNVFWNHWYYNKMSNKRQEEDVCFIVLWYMF